MYYMLRHDKSGGPFSQIHVYSESELDAWKSIPNYTHCYCHPRSHYRQLTSMHTYLFEKYTTSNSLLKRAFLAVSLNSRGKNVIEESNRKSEKSWIIHTILVHLKCKEHIVRYPIT